MSAVFFKLSSSPSLTVKAVATLPEIQQTLTRQHDGGGVHVSASLPTASYIGRLDVLTELLSSSRKLQY